MKLMDDVFLTDSIEIGTTPEKIFEFFSNLVDDESYRAWHPDDHVTLRWLKGPPWQEGSVIYAEEKSDGKLYKLKFLVTKVIPNRRIEYVPVSWFMGVLKNPDNRSFGTPECEMQGILSKT